jgi:hypothetical protein
MKESIIDKEKDPIYYKVVNLIRNLTGLNLLAMGGIPFGIFMGNLLQNMGYIDTFYRGEGALAAIVSLVGSIIIHSISRKLIGLSGDTDLVGGD